MDLREIWTLYVHEVRSALRERSIVAVSIVVPVVMYPALLWALFAGMSFVEGQAERLTSRIAVQSPPEIHRTLLDSLQANGGVALVEWAGEPEEARGEVARGRIDAYVEFVPPGPAASALSDNFGVVVAYSEARERSRRARAHVEAVVASYREGWIDEARRGLGVPDLTWGGFAVARDDIATPEESARFILGLFVPFLTLITVALAAFYPAIDATAGERERSTWETLMTTAASRGNVAAAKYLYVASFGALGGLLNLTALALSLQWILQPLGEGGAGELVQTGIPLNTLPTIAVGVALLGLFVASGMLAFAVFARNFKEGQSMITPFYLVIVLPAVLVQAPDIELTVPLALIPVVNVALLLREAIMGSVSLLPGLVTLLSMGGSVALSVVFVQWVMRKEEVLLGSFGGGLGDFVSSRLRARRREA